MKMDNSLTILGMSIEELVLLGTLIVLLGTLIVLIIQVWKQRQDLRKVNYRYIYDRWGHISDLEIQHPEIHKLLLDISFFDDINKLPQEEMKSRALALIILDQFALIFKTGDRHSIYYRLEPKLSWILNRSLRLRRWWQIRKEASKTIFEYNEAYIRGVLCNPEMIKFWRDYKLGDTWKGDAFYDFVNQTIADHEAGKQVGLSCPKDTDHASVN